MAFYQDDEEENQGGGQGAVTTGPQSGQAGVTSTQGPVHGDSSGSFVGIKNYLNANQSQGAKLGDQAAGIINKSADQARNTVSGLSNKFNQAADQGTVQLDQDATNVAGTSAEKLNQNQSAQVKKQYNAQYGGPQNITDFNDDYVKAQSAVNQAAGNVQQQGTEEGRIGLAKQINQNAGKQSRTSGGLDNLLLQAGGGKDKLQTAADQNKDVVNSLSQAQEAAGAKANQAKAVTDATRAQTRQTIGQLDDPTTPQDESGGAFGTLKNYLSGKATDLSNQYQQNEDAAYTRNLSPDLAAQFGINPEQNLYNVRLDELMAKNPQAASWQNVAGADDVARYQALAGIADQDPNGLSAGDYHPYSIDKGAVQSAIGTAKKNYEDYATLKTPEAKSNLANFNNAVNGFVMGGNGNNVLKQWGFDKVTDLESARNALRNVEAQDGGQWIQHMLSSRNPKAAAVGAAYSQLKNYVSSDTEAKYTTPQGKKGTAPTGVVSKGKA